MGKIGVLFLSLLIGFNAWSAESFNQSNIQLFRPPPSDKSFLLRWDLSLTQTRYSGAPQIVEQGQKYSSIIPSFQIYRQWGATELAHSNFYADGLVVFPMSDGVDLGAAFPEVYYSRESEGQEDRLTLGRKIYAWSELDSYWKLGLWQPLVRWDAANPIEQGLTGIFWEHSKRNVRTALFLSGLNIPDQQPSYEEKDGKIVSANRWFRAPVAQVSLQQTNRNISYNVQEPSLQEVILQPSIAGAVELGRQEEGPFIRLAISNKPANQFHLVLKGTIDIGTTDVTVPVLPQVVRHNLITSELGYRTPLNRVVLSNTLEKYGKPDAPENWEQTELMDSHYSGVVWQHDLSAWGLKKSNISASYVQRKKINESSGKSSNLQGDVESSTQRFQFEEMAGVQIQANILRTYKRELDAIFKYVYSINDRGEWLQTGLLFRHNRRWNWNLSVDVFGVPEDTNSSTSFISKFRGNDRVSSGVTYVF